MSEEQYFPLFSKQYHLRDECLIAIDENKSLSILEIKELESKLSAALSELAEVKAAKDEAVKWMKGQASLIEMRERAAWDAAREQEMYNAHDPNGERQEREKALPPYMQTIGLAFTYRTRYLSFESWQSERERLRRQEEFLK